MNHANIFSLLAIAAIILMTLYPSIGGLTIMISLFFLLGLPHGALDIVLGKEMLYGYFGKKWWIPFSVAYLCLSFAVIALWTLWPFLSFILFLLISVFHFGFGDAVEKYPIRSIEGIARGLIPITTPAFFYPYQFQTIIQSTLSTHDAALITSFLSQLFMPNFILVAILSLGLIVKKKISYAFELVVILGVFIALAPFQAFLIYFCFLHSIRHTLMIMKETHKSLRSIAISAILPTLFSAIFLIGLYYILRSKETDLDTMYYLFFMGIAALTFPHMLLVEGLYSIKNSSKEVQKEG